MELQNRRCKMSVLPPILREPVQSEGAHSGQARHQGGDAAVRDMPEAHAQPIMLARAYVPPSQTGSLSGPA